MLYLQVDQPTERLKFALNYIFGTALKTPYRITTDAPPADASCLRIGRKADADLYAGKLLYETDIPDKHVTGDLRTAFPAAGGLLDYDLLALTFFMLARYEEYQSYAPDKHGRFPAAESWAYRQNRLQTPFVDERIRQFGERLKTRFPQLPFGKHEFEFIPTIDVDQAAAYRGKGLLRNTGGLFRDLMRKRFDLVAERAAVLGGLRHDPFDTFDDLQQLHRNRNLRPTFFILLADRTDYDKNLPHTDKRFSTLIRRLAENADIGLHPSYYSSDRPELIAKEAARLSDITGQTVCRSRQHFLRFRFPDTFRALQEAGIRAEYSLAYADRPGFRAGVCRPFPFFDIPRNTPTDLMLYPSCVMDVTLRNYLVLNTKQTLETIIDLQRTVRRFGGLFIPIWHNESVGTIKERHGLRTVYERMLAAATGN